MIRAISYWIGDFEIDESTDAIPDKFILTIYRGIPGDVFDSEEVAHLVHRASDAHPVDGATATAKRALARRIVEALELLDDVESNRYSVKDNQTGDWIL